MKHGALSQCYSMYYIREARCFKFIMNYRSMKNAEKIGNESVPSFLFLPQTTILGLKTILNLVDLVKWSHLSVIANMPLFLIIIKTTLIIMENFRLAMNFPRIKFTFKHPSSEASSARCVLLKLTLVMGRCIYDAHCTRGEKETSVRGRRGETMENAERVLPRVIWARCVRTKRVVALSRALIVTCHHTNALRRNCSDPLPAFPAASGSGINARIMSASYHAALPLRVTCYGRFSSRENTSDRSSVGHFCEWA